MPSVFNILRASVYSKPRMPKSMRATRGSGVDCDLPGYCGALPKYLDFIGPHASLLIILALLGFGFWKERNPISTRVELGCLGLVGVLWLALAAFVASSDSEDADVECFSSSDSSEVVDVPGFNTEIYQAQYRVLEAFSFFNVILIWLFFFFLLILALRHHQPSKRMVWLTSVTAYSWFNGSGKGGKQLPAPVTQRSRSQSKPAMREKIQDPGPSRAARIRDSAWHIIDIVRPQSFRGGDRQRTPAYTQRAQPHRQDTERARAYRQDSQRTQPYRQDSQRTQVHRQDSSRAQMYRQDSSRSQVKRQDSSRAQAHRQDSQRTNPQRQDSQRTMVDRQTSQRSQKELPQRQDSRSRGRLPQTTADAPTRNESPTYVYWLPHKAPDPAHMTQLFKEMRLYGFGEYSPTGPSYLRADHCDFTSYDPLAVNYSARHCRIFGQHDFGIFSLIVPSLTILIFLIIIGWSAPRTEAIALFILGVLWLAMGAWSTDIIGNTQCDALGNARIATKNGTMSSKSYCYLMKVIEAFSWMTFCLYAIFLWILIALTSRARAFGRPLAWAEPIFELPWFGELPGWPYSGAPGMYPAGAYAQGMPYPPQLVNGQYLVQQMPGHSVMIQPGAVGGMPAVTQVPGDRESSL
ncbi:hypothetical protein WOLCODRAFT_89104 [Wolfiporia cocos MD-104 SS10]|uniref:Uncharacterized protein n=1 Tax=Wolfiporia cocos (strain MD-104) TaxID=742152 RepID=A0A2H3JYI1_WOLCO|nr:hypothetical protein WOLCODRAFT_89104 [Wolfiporia cocos MD-104 SS10]